MVGEYLGLDRPCLLRSNSQCAQRIRFPPVWIPPLHFEDYKRLQVGSITTNEWYEGEAFAIPVTASMLSSSSLPANNSLFRCDPELDICLVKRVSVLWRYVVCSNQAMIGIEEIFCVG